MNQKDLIKYGLLALGAYLVWKYVQDHGGIEAILGTAPALPAPHPTTGTGTGTTTGTTPAPTPLIQQTATLDLTGLAVTQDVNDSLSGTVKINGLPVRLSIITADGRVFNQAGQEVTASLESSGVDLAGLRAAFQTAPQLQTAMAGLAGVVNHPWLM